MVVDTRKLSLSLCRCCDRRYAAARLLFGRVVAARQRHRSTSYRYYSYKAGDMIWKARTELGIGNHSSVTKQSEESLEGAAIT